MRIQIRTISVSVFILSICFAFGGNCFGQHIEWYRIGSELGGTDISYVDDENIFLVGGDSLGKFDSAGNLIWNEQLGFSGINDWLTGVSADSLGNVYSNGVREGNLFLAKHDKAGNQEWFQIYGTNSSETINTNNIQADGFGDVYIIGTSLLGTSTGSLLRKFNSDGELVWSRSLEKNSHAAGAVSVDHDGNVYIGGSITIDGEGMDGFVAKYGPDGSFRWESTVAVGLLRESIYNIAADSLGNVFVGGITRPEFLGDRDIMFAKLDSEGDVQWIRSYGTTASDVVRGIEVDEKGNVFIAGDTGGALAGPHGGGSFDHFVGKFDRLGNEKWFIQYGSYYSDRLKCARVRWIWECFC